MRSVKYYAYSIQGNKSLFSARTENSKLWLCRLQNSRPEYVKENEQVYRQLDPAEELIRRNYLKRSTEREEKNICKSEGRRR